MIAFLIFAISSYLYFQKYILLYLFSGGLFLILFLVLIGINLRLRDRLLLVKNLLFLITNELGAQDGRPNSFPDGNSLQSGHAWLDDLDIFGPNSLFHFLNRTSTTPGSRRLANNLIGPPPSAFAITGLQAAVQILSKQMDQVQILMASGLQTEKETTIPDLLESWFESPAQLVGNSWVKFARWFLPLYTLASLYSWIQTDNYWPMLIGIAACWIFIQPFSKYISRQHQLIGKKEPLLDQYVSILKAFDSIEPGSSNLLNELKLTAQTANKKIRRLSKLASAFDQRTNNLVKLFGNSFVLYDIQCMLSLEKWKNENRKEWSAWLSCVAEIESLSSLAVFAFNHPDACYPVFADDLMILEATQLAHPLIPVEERIANDFTFGKADRIQLITGSNMSGKTTVLRTIAVNLLLAQSGAPVIASYFCFLPMQILGSLRTQDSLQEHSSYFLAELKKLQQIIQVLEKGGPAIVLIDEILKGTNSEDKTMGSEKFIHKLLQYNCLALFATHDLALSKLQADYPGQLSNYCFESQIRDGELFFDYSLHEGVAKNKNATFLMHKMGIIS